MAKGTLEKAHCVKRKPGRLYYVDGSGNVRSTPMKHRKHKAKASHHKHHAKKKHHAKRHHKK